MFRKSCHPCSLFKSNWSPKVPYSQVPSPEGHWQHNAYPAHSTWEPLTQSPNGPATPAIQNVANIKTHDSIRCLNTNYTQIYENVVDVTLILYLGIDTGKVRSFTHERVWAMQQHHTTLRKCWVLQYSTKMEGICKLQLQVFVSKSTTHWSFHGLLLYFTFPHLLSYQC